MIVLGKEEHLDFSVLIYESLDPDRPEKDCVEEHYSDGDVCIII